jgi:hypothetical protein
MKRILVLALIVLALGEGAVFATPDQKDPKPPAPPTHMATGRRQWRSRRHRHQGHHRGRKRAAMLLPGGKNW